MLKKIVFQTVSSSGRCSGWWRGTTLSWRLRPAPPPRASLLQAPPQRAEVLVQRRYAGLRAGPRRRVLAQTPVERDLRGGLRDARSLVPRVPHCLASFPTNRPVTASPHTSLYAPTPARNPGWATFSTEYLPVNKPRRRRVAIKRIPTRRTSLASRWSTANLDAGGTAPGHHRVGRRDIGVLRHVIAAAMKAVVG